MVRERKANNKRAREEEIVTEKEQREDMDKENRGVGGSPADAKKKAAKRNAPAKQMKALPPSSRPAAGSSRFSFCSEFVTEEMVVAGIRKQMEDCIPTFATVKALRAKYHQPPVPSSLKIDIVSSFDCSIFRSHSVVLARSQATFRFSTKHLPRSVATSVDGCEEVTESLDWETMHFVRRDGEQRGSFEVQSVRRPENCLFLECYARLMVSFAFCVSAMEVAAHSPNVAHFKGPLERQSAFCQEILHPRVPSGPIVVLGMGGNVIPDCLGAALPGTEVHVVEIEPAVWQTCRTQCGYPRTMNLRGHEGSVEEMLPKLPTGCSFIFFDCFDPVNVTMVHAAEVLRGLCSHIRDDGVIIINSHIEPEEGPLGPFVDVFGSGNVHVVNFKGYKQSFVACFKRAARVDPLVTFTVKHFAKISEIFNATHAFGGLELDVSAVGSSKKMTFKLPPREGQVIRRWVPP